MLTNWMKRQIEEIQNSNKEEDMTKLEILKKCLQDLNDHEENSSNANISQIPSEG